MTDLELRPDLTPAPTTLFASDDPAVIVARATRIAETIAPVIRSQNLVKRIGASEHVFLEGWTLAGSMLGVFPITVASGAIFAADGTVLGYQATVEARTMAGNIVGRADAECTRDENDKWRQAPSFQLRSMAITRASSKALRMPLGFVMKLAGYETTPAEEMEAAAARGETVSGGHGVRPGWRDIQEQNSAHSRLNVFLANNGLGEWVGRWLDSKGYPRPLSRSQMNELRRAVDRELAERAEQSGVAGAAPSASTAAPDPSPSAPEQEEAPETPEPARPGAEGANGRSGAVPPDDATAPPESTAAPSPGRRSSGGSKPVREDDTKGKRVSSRATSDEGEQ